MPPAVQEVLAHTPLIQQCQLLDFVRNESYHRTVLCQRDAVPERNYRVAVVKRCSVSLVAAPQQAECEIGSHAPFGFAFPQGTLTTTAPLGKAAIRCLLDARPQPLTLEALHAAALARLPDNVRQPADEGDGGLTVLSQAMLGAACAGIARLYLDPPRFRSQIEPFPVATPLARALARRSTYVINQWHENVVLTPLQYLVLSRLDGTHDRDRLLAEAGVSLATGQLQHEGTPESLAAAIDAALGELCGKGLLI
jgi:methyltransferase-like protein